MSCLTLFFLLTAISTATIAQYDCPGVRSPLTPDLREQFVKVHNKYRAQLVEGSLANNYGVRLPRAGNVYEVTWNCTLEEQAQNWIDKCSFGHSSKESRLWAGENVYMAGTTNKNFDWPAVIAEKASTSWWNEYKDYRRNPTASGPFGNAGHFTQMAWHWVTAIGCGFANCTGKDGNPPQYNTIYVNCQYFPAGNVQTFPVYKKGDKCKTNKDCTTYHGSRCNTKNGLCIPPSKPLVDNLLEGKYLM